MQKKSVVVFLVGTALVISSFANPQAPEQQLSGENHLLISQFTQSAKLTTEGGRSGDHFGYPVAIDGDVIVVGAAEADSGGVVDSGAVYVYVKQGSGWFDMVQVAVLTASDKRAGDGFGRAVAIDGDTIVVGAPTADPGGVSNAGAAYYFTKPPAGWEGNLTETGQLFASDNEVEDDYGFSVAIDDGVIAVGALDVDVGSELWAGMVYLYLNDGAGWSGTVEDARLYASDYASGDWFGYCIDIDGDVIAVGAKYSDPGGYASGSAYVFVKPAGGWVTMTESAKLRDSNSESNDRFGGRIGISGDTIVIGADGDNPGGSMNAGAAFIYEKPSYGWSGQLYETAQLTSSKKENNEWNGFGTSVAIDGDLVVVGSRMQDSDGIVDVGVAYIFEKPISGWQDMTETDSVTAMDKKTGDEFGVATAINGTDIVVGAWYGDAGDRTDAGSAYVFDNSGSYYQLFTSNAAQDGYVFETKEFSEVGGDANSSSKILMLGDSQLRQQSRVILSFDTASLPENITITSVVLKIRKWPLGSGNPFLTLKSLIVDIRKPFFGSSVALASSDFQAVSSLNRAGVFGPSRWGWYSCNLRGTAFSFVNLNGTTQFRLRFALDDDNDSLADYVTFFSGNAAIKYRPILIVKYKIP